MSIYPVYLASWYPKKVKSDHLWDVPVEKRDEYIKEQRFLHDSAKSTIDFSACHKCGGKCTWKRTWGHHSIPWGHGDVWCSKKCLESK